ncbi:proline-rich protein 4-like [Wolffia australiana]
MGKACLTFLVCLALGYSSIAGASRLSQKLVAVSGAAECADCVSKNINEAIAFNGLNVAVYCKEAKGQFQIKGVGKLDEEGKFTVRLPGDVIKEEGGLKKHCFAQLHGGPKNKPCPAASGSFDSSKLVLQSFDSEKHTFGTLGKLSFSSETCTSAFFWYKPIPQFPWYCPPKYSQNPPTYGAPTRSSYSYPSPPY